MDPSGDMFLSDSVEPEIIAYSIEDCIIPGFHPPQPLGKLWPDGVPSRLIDVSTALVYLTPGLLAICTVGMWVASLEHFFDFKLCPIFMLLSVIIKINKNNNYY